MCVILRAFEHCSLGCPLKAFLRTLPTTYVNNSCRTSDQAKLHVKKKNYIRKEAFNSSCLKVEGCHAQDYYYCA